MRIPIARILTVLAGVMLACLLVAGTGCQADPVKVAAAQGVVVGAQADVTAAQQVVAELQSELAGLKAQAATQPSGAAVVAQIAKGQSELATAQRYATVTQQALDVAQSALAASKSGQFNPNDPAFVAAVSAAARAIPTPWAPVLAAAIPSLAGIAGLIVQNARQHQTVRQQTAALATSIPASSVTVAAAGP